MVKKVTKIYVSKKLTASATATVTLGIPAAHVFVLQLSYVCELTLFPLVPDDATAIGKIFKVLNKFDNVQGREHINSFKTKTPYKSKRILSIYIIWVQEIYTF